MAKATAGECQAVFSAIHITDILDPYLGVSERNIKDIFSNARRKKPCVLFFDEIDTIGYNRAKLSAEHMRPIIDQFLTEIEGIDSDTQNMLIIGATNMPWDVDPAFKRPGRLVRTIKNYVKYSNQSGIYDNVERYLSQKADIFRVQYGLFYKEASY